MKTTVIIKKNRDFTRMYRRAKTKTGPLLVTYCARNRLGPNRIGITASKRVGDAVRRNRAKRVIRAAYTGLEQQLPQLPDSSAENSVWRCTFQSKELFVCFHGVLEAA